VQKWRLLLIAGQLAGISCMRNIYRSLLLILTAATQHRQAPIVPNSAIGFRAYLAVDYFRFLISIDVSPRRGQEDVVCYERLGGLLKNDERKAA
jgi:hypothetical protein